MTKLKITGKLKVYLNTLGLVILLIVLFTVVYKLAIAQLPIQRNRYQEQIRKEQTLTQKIELLRTLDASLLEQANLTSFALPNKNPAFMVASQLKLLAQENSIIITNLRIGSETKDGNLWSTDLSFDVEGATVSVLNFLKGISGIAPITFTDKVRVNESFGISRATIRVKTFWAEFPATLPAISQPAVDLTKDEGEILTKVVNLVPPEFVFLEPQTPTERADPF